MKKNIKTVILYFSVFYIIIIVGLMMISYFNMPSKIIEISVNEDYVKQINNYKNKVSSLENSACKSYLNTLINRFEKDINKSEINLEEYNNELNDGEDVLDYYVKGMETCDKLTTDVMKENDMPILFLTASIQNEELIQEFVFQYELGLKDYKAREIRETSLITVKNNIKIQNELKIIDKLIEIISDKEEV